jgi:hypothetical protein
VRLAGLILAVPPVALLFGGGCEPPVVPATPRCDAPPPTPAPFVVDWPAADLDRFVSLAKQGTVVVHADGCSLRPLPECRTMGQYVFQPLPPAGDVEVVHDDLRELAPGAADRLAALGRDGTVRVERTFGGAWGTTHAGPSAAQLTGSCEGATHIVRAAYVGAFELASGNRSLASRGSAKACTPLGDDAKAPVAECDAWFKIELAPIAPMPPPGEACDVATQGCADPGTALLCVSGHLASIPCRGKAGCRIDAPATAPTCDHDQAASGDSCTSETYACSADGLDVLSCRSGTFTVSQHCRGPKHCASHGATIDCDTTEAQAGDACGDSAGFACTSDHGTMLRCQGGAFAPASSCRGPKGCALDAATFRVACDSTRARAGDPCDHPDGIACSEDGAAQLQCRGATWAKQRDCSKPCVVSGDTLRCGS